MSHIKMLCLILVLWVFDLESDETFVDLNDQACQPLKVQVGKKANVLCFTTTDCPIANGYSQRFNQLNKKYSSLGFELYLVHVDWDTSRKKAAKHKSDFDLEMNIVLDPQHILVKATGVSITPEVAVILPNGEIAYRGRIDNWYEGFGKKRNVINKTELADALDAILNNQKVPTKTTKAVGCSIPDLPTLHKE